MRIVRFNYEEHEEEVDKQLVHNIPVFREIEVLRELVKGDDKKKIAQNLFISERTLYNHLANIYDKLGINNAIEAYNKAMDLG
ncbi:response regulator transcription factor [Peptoniphilus obesi]|uniref:response regulator transcription factor n=1 Tax=Peptoniphilus obesi TaxID=1472765 RepID=UPI0009D921FA|nr:helix-turn-helix transcriptional regulator [Peptoniphilus obesi]